MSNLTHLLAISPVDGRYKRHTEKLGPIASEFALIRYRVRVEVEWFKLLISASVLQKGSSISNSKLHQCDSIWRDFSVEDASTVRKIEATTNHDVKAVEYFVKDKIKDLSLDSSKELVHFGCTSEDINNLAYGLMLKEAREQVVIPSMNEVINALAAKAEKYAELPMLSRTHGQVASPTTLGKELVNPASRLLDWRKHFESIAILGKMNGAVGNFNAHLIAAPDIDWSTLSATLVKQLGLDQNKYTTQIEPHDWIARYLDAVVGFNQVLLDLDRDIWSYISIGYFKQRRVDDETGSSTMPHKVNPIDFENAEGNIGVANSIAQHLSQKLLVSRLQRDLSDSTALRNLGVVLAHTEIGIRSTLRGLTKLDVDQERIKADLASSWEVLAEPIQTVLRRQGNKDPYETLKDLTRGETLDELKYRELLDQLSLDEETREQLEQLRPDGYTGMASALTYQAVKTIRES